MDIATDIAAEGLREAADHQIDLVVFEKEGERFGGGEHDIRSAENPRRDGAADVRLEALKGTVILHLGHAGFRDGNAAIQMPPRLYGVEPRPRMRRSGDHAGT